MRVAEVKFTKNYRDRSTDDGFRFEFFCDRGYGQWMPNWLAYHFADTCNYSYTTSTQQYPVGMANKVKEATSWLVNRWPQISAAGEAVNNIHKEAWDNAFAQAVNEAKRKFRHCTACDKWVCAHSCWNEPAGLCRGCAGFRFGDNGATKRGETVAEKAPENICPHCGSANEPGRFCATCGKSMEFKVFCGNCGKDIEGNRKFKFCPHCGDSLSYLDELRGKSG